MQITQEIIDKIDSVLSRGLSKGIGERNGQMCIEAAICYALDLPHGDDPQCVTPEVCQYKIILNDSHHWESSQSRAKGLRSLAIAQLGSRGVVDGEEFTERLAGKTIRQLIPKLFRELFPDNKKLLAAADRCEAEGTADAARAANAAAFAANALAAARAANAVAVAAAVAAANADVAVAVAAANAAVAVAAARSAKSETYLNLSAELALEVLQELGSPGCEWL